MNRVAIVGSGHLGQQIAYHIHEDTQDRVVGYFDDYQIAGVDVGNILVLGGSKDIVPFYEEGAFDSLVIAVGYKHMAFRSQLYRQLKGKLPFYTFIHSSTILDRSAQVGEGAILYSGCLIDQGVVIGNNVLLNIGCTVAHDSTIGDNSFLSPRVAIAGFVHIEEQCVLGINCTVIDNITVAPRTQLGGGTVLIKNIETAGLYVGNPARFVR